MLFLVLKLIDIKWQELVRVFDDYLLTVSFFIWLDFLALIFRRIILWRLSDPFPSRKQAEKHEAYAIAISQAEVWELREIISRTITFAMYHFSIGLKVGSAEKRIWNFYPSGSSYFCWYNHRLKRGSRSTKKSTSKLGWVFNLTRTDHFPWPIC